MKKALALFFILFNTYFLALAQSADKISEIIESTNVNYGQISYLAAIHAGLADETANQQQCLNTLEEKGFVQKGHSDTEQIPLEQVAFICAKTWNVKGGIFYSIFKNPRYSLKQLKADGVIPENSDPSKKLSGFEALNIISACIEQYGEN